MKLGLRDQNQYVIEKIITYKGDPLKRTTTSYLIKFMDGDIIWVPWSKDISVTLQFEDFCRSRSELTPLLYDEKVWRKMATDMNKNPITDVKPGDEFYLDIRSWGSSYYDNLDIPDADMNIYVVLCRYTKWENKSKTKIIVYCPLFKFTFTWSNVGIQLYGRNTTLTSDMILIDESFARKYPKLYG